MISALIAPAASHVPAKVEAVAVAAPPAGVVRIVAACA